MKNSIFKRAVGTVVAGFLAFTSVPFMAKDISANAAQTLTTSPSHTQETGWYNDYHHEIWQADTPNTSTMTLYEDGGGFSTKWQCGPNNSKGNFLARRGLFYGRHTGKYWQDYGNFCCDFDCTWSAGSSGNSRICIYGWTEDPLVEFYIIEDWKNWVPSSANAKQVTIDGSVYDVFTNPMNSYNITGSNGPFTQYISVRKTPRTSGTISIYKHFEAWESLGMKMGDFYEVAFNVEGWESDGQADVKTNVMYFANGDEPTGTTTTTTTTQPAPPPEPDANGDYITCSFESGEDNWTGRGDASVALDTSSYYDGKSSLKVTGRTDNWHGTAIKLDSKTFVPGYTYSISTAVLQNSGSAVEMKLTLQNTVSGKENYTEVVTADANSGEWTKLENTKFTIPEGATDLILYVEAPKSLTDFNIDTVQISKEGKASSVVNGKGTVNGSSSDVTTTTTTTVTTTSTTVTTTDNTPDVTLYGDANCDGQVNMADAILIMQYVSNPDKYGVGKPDGMSALGEKNADVSETGDGLTNKDALAVQKYKLGLINKLPESYSTAQKKTDVTTTTVTAVTTTTTFATTPPAPAADYFTSPFDSSVNSWSARGDASISVDNNNYYAGGGSLKITGRTKNWNGAAIALDSSFVAGGTYSFSAAVLQKVSASDDFKISLQYNNASGEESYDTIAEASASKNTWTKLENVAYTIPEGATDLLVYIETADTTINFFVDEFSVQEKGKNAAIVNGQGTVSEEAEPVIDPTKKLVAISFDDGAVGTSPTASSMRIINAIADQGWKATFFYVGDWIRGTDGENEVKYAYSKGMEIANHTTTHPYLSKKSSNEIRSEFDQTHAKLKNIIGAEPSKLLRLPFLDCNDTVKQTLSDVALISCSVDSGDWKDGATKDMVVNNIKQAAAQGRLENAIVLCHETKDHTAAAIEELVPWLEANGYQIVTISDLFAARGKTLAGGQVHTNA